MWRCHGRVIVAAMFLADSDGDGMCEWATLSSLFFSLSVSFSLSLSHTYTYTHTHLIHHITLLALTGLQPPLCFLINGLNRPPTMDLKRS